jgi:transposase
MSWDQRQRKPSPLDFTDEQWASLEPLLPTPRSKCGGRPREIAMREVINTIVYLNRSGCQRDMRPHDLLLTSSVNDYCTQWRDDGTWTKILAGLRERVHRSSIGADHGGRRRGVQRRRRQEHQAPQSACAGRYDGLAAGRLDNTRQCRCWSCRSRLACASQSTRLPTRGADLWR